MTKNGKCDNCGQGLVYVWAGKGKMPEGEVPYNKMATWIANGKMIAKVCDHCRDGQICKGNVVPTTVQSLIKMNFCNGDCKNCCDSE